MPLPKPLIALAALLGTAGIAAAAPLTVTVTDIEARGGTFYVGVQTEAQFMKDDGVAGEMIEAPFPCGTTSMAMGCLIRPQTDGPWTAGARSMARRCARRRSLAR